MSGNEKWLWTINFEYSYDIATTNIFPLMHILLLSSCQFVRKLLWKTGVYWPLLFTDANWDLLGANKSKDVKLFLPVWLPVSAKNSEIWKLRIWRKTFRLVWELAMFVISSVVCSSSCDVKSSFVILLRKLEWGNQDTYLRIIFWIDRSLCHTWFTNFSSFFSL